MLNNTFIHIQGIGLKTEKQIWGLGSKSWENFLNNPPSSLSPAKIALIAPALKTSQRALTCSDPNHFTSRLQVHQHWRLFKTFRHTTAYLDIETTGLDFNTDTITTVALFDGSNLQTFVKGHNLQDFLPALTQYQVLVTYNGKCFDLPFIQKQFGVRIEQAHIDLRFVLSSLGFKGGLKRIEQNLGMDRGPLREVDGYMAVLMWRSYEHTRDPRVLETLLAYNAQDSLNLEWLMVEAFNRKLAETPFFEEHRLSHPQLFSNPYRAHADVLQHLTRGIL